MSLRPLRDVGIQWRVAGHLLLILFLVAANLGGIWWFLQEQHHDGAAINQAGEQRMLTQRMALRAHLLGAEGAAHRGGAEPAELRAGLAADAATYNRTLTALIRGNESMGIPPAPASVRGQLLSVRSTWRPFHGHVQTLLSEPPTSPAFADSLEYVERHDERLLTESDEAVARYELAFERKIVRLQWFLIGVFGLDLLVIPLLFVFIDRQILQPINRVAADARSVAGGDLSRSITRRDSADEVGKLTHSLHEMKEQLASAIRDAERFEQAVERAGHAIYITDTEGTIEYVNPAFEEITGYGGDEAVGTNPRILQSGQRSEPYYEALWETIRSGDVWREEIVNKRASGERFHAYQTIAPITDEHGDLVGFVAILSDNTEQIVSTQQNQVLSRVLRHNLRTELNLIDGFVREIETTRDADRRAECARSVRDRVERLVDLSEMADRCARYVQREVGRHPHEVRPVVDQVCAKMRASHPSVSITAETPPAGVAVRANVELVLEELVGNAIEHNDRPEPAITVAATRPDEAASTIVLEISDDGPGIPREERLVIEEGEETPLFHGSGLGLWLVHWTVMLAGGEVTIEDRSPRGTRVLITLPIVSTTPSTRSAWGTGSTTSGKGIGEDGRRNDG